MKLSTRSLYGLRALVELGLMSGRGPVSASVIAVKQDLSVAYLEQLLHRLKKQGLVLSVRGPKGGYVLAKDPEQISIAEVVQILDGSARRRGSAAELSRRAQPVAYAVYRCLHERLAEVLDRVTLQDVCTEAAELSGEPVAHRYVFHI